MIRSGTSGNDTLTTSLRTDVLKGLSGNDRLTAGTTFNSLYGGPGEDTFVFAVTGASGLQADIGDFVSRQADPSQADLVEITGVAGGGSFIGTAAFGGTGTAAVRLDSANEQLQVDADGDGSANFEVGLSGYTAASQLTTTDFLFSS